MRQISMLTKMANPKLKKNLPRPIIGMTIRAFTMKMMFQNVAYVASNGDHGMSAASSAMRKVYDMSNSSPEVFDLILKEFTKRYLT